jgi:sodium-dependent dicarboxylate transporter 2/3/5
VAVVIITSSWWILEPIPLAVASLAPFLLFPAFGVTGAADIATAYFNDQIFIFITSYIIAIGIEECNLHKRFALTILYMTFGIPILILGGFMFIAFFLSMWLNNTSTAAMLLPMWTTTKGTC